MSTEDITRVPNKTLLSKSSVAVYRLPGGGGFLWAVATSPDRTQDIKVQTLGCLGVIDGYLKANGLDRSRIVKARSSSPTTPTSRPSTKRGRPGCRRQGSGRSFVQSIMPEGDMIEIIITAALLP
jgi:hypothetical protein